MCLIMVQFVYLKKNKVAYDWVQYGFEFEKFNNSGICIVS